MLTDLDLMTLHIHALFLLDDQDRMLAVNEPDPPQAPRLYLGRTTSGNIWRFRHDLPDDVVRDLEPLLRAEPPALDLTQPPQCLAAVQAVLTRHAPATASNRHTRAGISMSKVSQRPRWRSRRSSADRLAENRNAVCGIRPRRSAAGSVVRTPGGS